MALSDGASKPLLTGRKAQARAAAFSGRPWIGCRRCSIMDPQATTGTRSAGQESIICCRLVTGDEDPLLAIGQGHDLLVAPAAEAELINVRAVVARGSQ